MSAFIVLLLAVVSRIFPLTLHHAGWNFTALGGGLLFFGSRMGAQPGRAWQTIAKLAAAVAVLAATDYYLTVYAYRYPFQVRAYAVTWIWYAAVCLIGMGLLQKTSVLRVAAGILASATSFFLVSNLMVWIGGTVASMYPHTLAGLSACYAAALPFYRNDLVSTGLTAGVLFGLPVLAAKIVESLREARGTNLAA